MSGRCRAALISHWPAHLAVRSVASCYFSLPSCQALHKRALSTIDEEPTLARFFGGLGIDSGGRSWETPQAIQSGQAPGTGGLGAFGAISPQVSGIERCGASPVGAGAQGFTGPLEPTNRCFLRALSRAHFGARALAC